ncbi:MAG TPA: hypothetical protein VI306_02490 [Pyrinomonadaceae bacterium]
MSYEDQLTEDAYEALLKLRLKLSPDQLDALEELMEGLVALDIEERKRVCEVLIKHLKEIIENSKPVN